MAEHLFRKPLAAIRPYTPGKSPEEIKKEFGLQQVHRLNANENPYGCSPKVRQAVMETMETPSCYPDDYTTRVREAIAGRYGVHKDEILFGNGTDEIIYFLGKAFINEGDEVVTGQVTFFSYDESILAMGGKMVYVPMKDHGFDLDGIIGAITEKTRMVIVCNPNNPTGTVFHEAEQYAFFKKIPKNVLVVMDEAYAEFYMGRDYPDTYGMLREFDNLIILKTFSKVYGLASFRIGYAIADKELISIMTRVKNLFNVSAQAQAAAEAAIRDQEFVKMVRQKNHEAIKYFCERLDGLGLTYIPTHTSFIMVKVPGDSKSLTNSLMEKGFLVRAGDVFKMPGYLRVSIGTKEQMAKLADALQAFI